MGRSIMPLLLTLLLAVVSPTSSSPPSFRVELTHVDSGHNLTKFERIQRATVRSHHRMARLTGLHANTSNLAASSASINNIRSSVHAGNGEFLMDLAIGTPSVPFSAIVDTGSDLIWTQCKPCVECFDQSTQIFDPKKSSTYSALPCTGDLCSALPTSMCNSDSTCEYLYSYGDSSSTQGVLGSETFTLGSVKTPHIGFGCGDTNQGSGFSQGAGLVGLGRGPLSLASQLNVGKFSYCLTSLDDTSKKSPLLFGSLAELNGSAIKTTPLAKNSVQPSFYYVNLKGITVGKTPLKFPSTAFALQDNGTGGLIIDSGTSITYLNTLAYKALKKAFLSQVKLQVADGSDVGLDLCFQMSKDSSAAAGGVPKLVLHFEGADLDLPGENYMVLDSSTGLLCLTVMGSSGMSIIGNFQQQNMQILYDLEKESLSFMPAHCDQL
ncbi:uncharacterized protein A4U43_C06F16270 [Asparagus officinalis]|uniref:Peptidase A1 domain-containing protein n=1 Tax=Asparagus officinalis TaxID=4686 RepID=A0A5P1ERE3_ASPOF|nr:aspartic proteinase nepenthesin-1-like [Asparagus officinalis]ONK67141.1 uncharacterized protein A4U43_C06F16270 [Asparagus officinalis]